MILRVHDLTDLLGSLTDTKFWFVKRFHHLRWYYLYSYEEPHNIATWTQVREKAIAYTYERAAKDVEAKLAARCKTLKVEYERIRS